jgi:hypothetical protein
MAKTVNIVDVILQIVKSFSSPKVKQESTLTTQKMTLNTEKLAKDLFYGSLPSYQLEPLEAILNELHRRDVKAKGIYAYAMATAYHETHRFKYKEEIGQGSGRKYGKSVLIMSGITRKFYGRGFTQITWIQNYVEMSIKCSMAFNEEIDLVSFPERVYEDHRINAFILCEGMMTGSFTDRKITDYINENESPDFVSARKVINGTDDAQLIAGYAEKFMESINGQ